MAERKPRSIFVWIILGLIFVGLIGFGSSGLSGNVRTIGSVGDKPLNAQSYFREVQTQIRMAEAQQGRTLSFPEAEANGLPQRALQRLIATRVLDNETARMGLSVGNDVISEQVLANPSFRGADGTFDQATYRDLLQRNGMSVREFETSLREDASRNLLQAAVFTGLPAPDTYGSALARFTREGRTFTWATVSSDDVTITLSEPSDADIQAYYDAHPDAFTTPESRAVSYAWLTPEMIQDEMPVDDSALQQEYENRIEDFQQPERRLVERLGFANAQEAQAAMDAITAGETDFPALVEDRGLSLNDIDLGDVTEAQLGEAGEAVFAAQTGDVVGPFVSDLGPVLYRMNAILAARDISFEEAEAELREDLAAAGARRYIQGQIDPIENLLAGGAGLSDLAEQTEMQLGQIDMTADTSTGIAAYDSFREAALSTDPGTYPNLVQLDDGGLFALEVTELRAPTLLPLDEVREDAIAGWETAETQAALAAGTEELAEQLRGGTDFAELGLESLQETNLTRRAFINGTPPTFVSEVFVMEPGAVRVIPNGDTVLLVRLDTVNAADEADDVFATEAETLTETAAEGIAQDIYELYNRAVQVRTTIDIDDAALNAVNSAFR